MRTWICFCTLGGAQKKGIVHMPGPPTTGEVIQANHEEAIRVVSYHFEVLHIIGLRRDVRILSVKHHTKFTHSMSGHEKGMISEPSIQ
mgnify:CR=1 FL=1